MFAIKIIHGLSWPRWHDTSINIYFCSQYISLIKPKLYSFTISNNCKLLEKSHHIKEMFEDSKMEIRSGKLKDRQYNGQLKKYTLPFLEQHLSGILNRFNNKKNICLLLKLFMGCRGLGDMILRLTSTFAVSTYH
jgi:hypothetical protein